MVVPRHLGTNNVILEESFRSGYRPTAVVCMRRKRGPKCTMLKDRDCDVTPYIIAHMYPQMHQGSANSARCIVDMGDCRHRECA